VTGTRDTTHTVTIHVPFRVVKRGARKLMHLPDGHHAQRSPDGTLIKALARAFRWKRMLDDGEFATIADLAHREGIALSYLTRLLQLTRLAPDIVETILDGIQDRRLTADMLKVSVPVDWDGQRRVLTGTE
jgi:hypothetical protein